MTLDRHPRLRLLVIANETVESELLELTIRALAGEASDARVLIVAPALNTRLRHWLSDSDAARDAARGRLGHCLGRLALAGIDANWLARNLVERVEGRFAIPVVHIVVDRELEREEVSDVALAAA